MDLSVLVVGCGNAARMHSRTLRRIGGVALSFASRDSARAEQFCRTFGGRRAFGSYESAMRDDSIDVVLITTPTASHLDLAVVALREGHHVIVEKPAFMSTLDADVARDAATASGKTIMIAENYYYKPIAAYLRKVVRAGRLGEVRFVTIDATKQQRVAGWRADPAQSGGGALFEGGVHWISFASNIGLDVIGIEAIRTGGSSGHDRSSLVVLRYDCGAVATIMHSWEIAAPLGHLRRSKIQGTAGAVTFESNGLARFTSGRARSVALNALRDPFGYRTMLEDFVGAVRQDREPRFSLAMARRDLCLLEEAETSMNTCREAVAPWNFVAGGAPAFARSSVTAVSTPRS